MATQEEEVLAAFSGRVTGLPVSYDNHRFGVTELRPYDTPYPPDQSGGWYLVQLVPSFTMNQRMFTSAEGQTRTEWFQEPRIVALWARRAD